MRKLYRAVDPEELQSIHTAHHFLPSPNGTEYKGFFFSRRSADKFALRESIIRQKEVLIVSGIAPEELVDKSPVHEASGEGSGVLIRNEDLWQVQLNE